MAKGEGASPADSTLANKRPTIACAATTVKNIPTAVNKIPLCTEDDNRFIIAAVLSSDCCCCNLKLFRAYPQVHNTDKNEKLNAIQATNQPNNEERNLTVEGVTDIANNKMTPAITDNTNCAHQEIQLFFHNIKDNCRVSEETSGDASDE